MIIVAFLAKCACVLAAYLTESYLAMEQFESRFHLFSSFFFYLKKNFTVLSSVSCPWTQTNSLLMKQKGIPPALVSGCDDLQYNRGSSWCKDWVQWGKQNLACESHEAFGRDQICILIWGDIAVETDLISKVFIIQMSMTILGYFKNMSCRIFPGFQNQGRLMFVVLLCLNILFE